MPDAAPTSPGVWSAAGASLKGLRILLVDDVMTTGATAAACSLARSGPERLGSRCSRCQADRRMPGALSYMEPRPQPRPVELSRC